MTRLKYHPLADIFPLIEGSDFAALVEDIRANGLQEAIWLHPDGRILDGRNRYRACLEAKVDPRFRTWDGKGSLVSFVVSLNLRRRHLNESQKGILALKIEPLLAKEAEQRQKSGKSADGLAGGRGKTNLPDLGPEGLQRRERESREKAAKVVGVSGRTVQRAKKLAKAAKTNLKAKALLADAHAGKETITHALRVLKKAEVTEAAQLPSDKFRVLYADPPWKYGDKLTEDYGGAEYHYPTMSESQLCALDISTLAEENAVLFLWVTSPLLESAFPIIKAWGFTYKTSFVWDKVKHNMGHYNSVRHELLLVATRGSCTPDVAKLYDSVVSIERTEHSRKPVEFRQIIETLYVHGKRIELFARERVPGWEPWGNDGRAAAKVV